MKKKKLSKLFILGLAALAILSACGGNEISSASNDNENNNNENITKIKVAFAMGGKPITYVDDDGNPTGYDVDAMKLVDEKLEDYEFEFIPTSDEDLLIGVEQGKYDVGVKNTFFTEEREKKFIFPKEFLGLSSAGILLKKENEHIKDLSDFAEANMALAPIAASNAQYTVVEEYNEANPDNPVKLVAGDEFSVDVIQWVNEGRADGGISIEASFNAQVLNEDGPYHNLVDDVVYNEFAVIKTWPIFNKNQQEFADAYDEAMAEIQQSDALSELMLEHYGKDLFEVLDSVNR
ncbi:transporter substrate-binding domain-containing protein [Pseudogracilibacillus sp. SO30301A]|uniref:transporter substrate-binding domain-containing protein n=1 Tax=Pseudogracilibacillus sp. SO30301A TaxID=3098291 RepID=UPI00300DE4CE